jgi:hypothetical protein
MCGGAIFGASRIAAFAGPVIALAMLFLVTMGINVPLNDEVAAAGPPTRSRSSPRSATTSAPGSCGTLCAPCCLPPPSPHWPPA